jgi:hypothetical protein
VSRVSSGRRVQPKALRPVVPGGSEFTTVVVSLTAERAA